MSKACNCKDAQETHEHCKDCDCILNWNESEFYCRWCEERRKKEAQFCNEWNSIIRSNEVQS